MKPVILSAGDCLCSRLRAVARFTVFVAAGLVPSLGWTWAADQASIDRIHAAARDFAQAGNWEGVEKQRLARLALLDQFPEDSPWRRGLDAIVSSHGLVAALRYKDAIGQLRSAWAPFAAGKDDAVVFGDVAARMFEVTQQALAVYPDALDAGAPGCLAAKEELRAALTLAIERDPCQVEAKALAIFLESRAEGEAFLRAEVRPSLKRQNQELVAIAHGDDSKKRVLPWHAGVEMLKARNSLELLEDLIPVEEFLRDSNLLQGRDANNAPFCLLLRDRFLLMEIVDSKGIPGSAVVFRDRGKWQKRNVRLLWRKPKGSAASTDLDKLMNGLVPIEEWDVAGHSYAIYDLPIEKIDALLAAVAASRPKSPELLCLGVSRFRDIPAARDRPLAPEKLIKQIEPFCTSYLVGQKLLTLTRSKVSDGLEGITHDGEGMNPLVLFSKDGEGNVVPPFFESGGSPPFLLLEDGVKLEVPRDVPEFVARFPTADGHIPLDLSAVPESLVVATAAGEAFRKLLAKAGYKDKEFMSQMKLDSPGYIPPKFKAFLDAESRRRRAPGPDVWRALQREVGWDKPEEPLDDLRSRLSRYGFRYLQLRDVRGSVVASKGLLNESSTGSADRPFAIRARDGLPVDAANLYTTADYVGLYANVSKLFYPAMIAYHPCIPAWGRGLRFERSRMAASLGLAGGGSAAERGFVVIPETALPLSENLEPEYASLVKRLTRDYLGEVFLETTRGAPVGPGAEGGPSTVRSVKRPAPALFFMQHAAARQAVREKQFHRAIVFFNDVVRGWPAFPALDVSLFDRVPSTKELQDFGANFEGLVDSQRFILIVQAEQAAALRGGGLEDSARFLWRTISDQYHLYTLPMLEIAADYGRSYGFAPPPRARQAQADIERYVSLIEQGAARAGVRDVPWQNAPDDPQALKLLEQLEAAARDNSEGGRTQDQGTARTPNAILSDVLPLRRSVSVWWREKSVLSTVARNGLFRSVHPLATAATLAPVADIDPTNGFILDFHALFSAEARDRLQAWLQDQAGEIRSADEGLLQFLVGWYLLDQGDPIRAKVAFIAAARPFLKADDGDTPAALIARRNGLFLLLAAACVTETPPGVDAFKADFLDGLKVQATAWRRRWFARGLPAIHADRQSVLISDTVDRIRRHLAQAADESWNRYFFVDYRFRLGPVPDIIAADALTMRLYESVPRGGDGRPLDKPPENQAGGRELAFEEFMNLRYPPPREIDEVILKSRPPKP